jgi:hypothetical protein
VATQYSPLEPRRFRTPSPSHRPGFLLSSTCALRKGARACGQNNFVGNTHTHHTNPPLVADVCVDPSELKSVREGPGGPRSKQAHLPSRASVAWSYSSAWYHQPAKHSGPGKQNSGRRGTKPTAAVHTQLATLAAHHLHTIAEGRDELQTAPRHDC